MKKIIYVIIIVLCGVSVLAQEYDIIGSELYKYIVETESANYILKIKPMIGFESVETESEDYILNPGSYVVKDFLAPTQPAGLNGVALDCTRIKLSFLASTDNILVYGYNIYRNDQLIGFTPDESYIDTNLTPMTCYKYHVQAIDKSKNVSEASHSVYVTTMDEYAAGEPPVFVSGPYVGYATNISAVIDFRTSKATVGVIEYGPTTAYGKSVTVDEYLEEHTVTLTGLDANSIYHYKVSITDYSGNGPIESEDDIFYTYEEPDVLNPEYIINPLASYISATCATITFQTDEDTIGFVEYGETGVGENVEYEVEYGTEHSITIYNLEPFTSYYFRVGITDRSGNGPVYSDLDIFITLQQEDGKAPVITRGPLVTYLTDTRAVVSWETNEPSNSVVVFGRKKGEYTRQVSSQIMTQKHTVLLLNLKKHTTYYYAVYSTDPSGNVGTSEGKCCQYKLGKGKNKWPKFMGRLLCIKRWGGCKRCRFKTKKHADIKVPKLKRIEVRVAADSATVKWETDELSDSLVVYGTESGIYTGQRYNARLNKQHEIKLVNLEMDTSYYFQIISRDPSGNKAHSVEHSLKTEEYGTVSELEIDNISASHARRHIIIQWRTNNKANSRVLYRKEEDSYWQEGYGWRLVKKHIIRLAKRGLSSGRYYYKVYSRDEYNQELEVSLDQHGNMLMFEVE